MKTFIDWFAPFAVTFSDFVNGIANEHTCALMDTAEAQISMREGHDYSDRPCVWTWQRMMARTKQEWQRPTAREGGE